MNSFERMGAAQLAAFEDQRQIRVAVVNAVGAAFRQLGHLLDRQLSFGSFAPW
jgi:hypothetical protein